MDKHLLEAVEDYYKYLPILNVTAAPYGNYYKFNESTGIPDTVLNQTHDFLNKHKNKMLNYTDHAKQQAKNSLDGKHGVHPKDIPDFNNRMPHPEKGWSPVEVEHDGKNVKKVVMRKPMGDDHHVTMPIVENHHGQPLVTTMWKNHKDDNHSTLNKHRIHTPDEFIAGQPPTRKVM